MAQLKAGGRTYDLRWVTGKVVGQGKHVETHVSGSGSGGSSSHESRAAIVNVFYELLVRHLRTLSTDLFANYLFQRLLPLLSTPQRRSLLHALLHDGRHHLVAISCDRQ